MLIVLVGPKGSGKSHIGRLLEARLGVHFFHVEPHWMHYHAACAGAERPVHLAEGIAHVHPRIAEALEAHAHVCVETTGASPEILDDLLALGEPSGRLLVRVAAPLALCLERIAARNPAHQIPMDTNAIREVYALSTAAVLPFDVVLVNVALTDEEILRPFAEAGLGKACLAAEGLRGMPVYPDARVPLHPRQLACASSSRSWRSPPSPSPPTPPPRTRPASAPSPRPTPSGRGPRTPRTSRSSPRTSVRKGSAQ